MRRILVITALVLGFSMIPITALLLTTESAPTEAEPHATAKALPTATESARPQTVFHVDCNAPENGDGTPARPWNTLQTVAAHGSFHAGDQILLARGSSCDGTLTPAGDGTAKAPILIGAYGQGPAPTVNGGGTPEQTGAVQLTDQQYWTVQDLTVTNRPAVPDGAYRSGVLVLNSRGGRRSGITLQRLTVRDVVSDPGWRDGRDPHEFGGIAVVTRTSDPTSGFDGLRIVGNDVERVGRVGIVSWNGAYPNAFDHDVTVADNTVSWAEGDSILLYGTDGGAITGNVSAYGGALQACGECRSDPGNTASAGIWPTRARNIVVEGNEIYGEHSARGDGEGLDVDIETQGVLVHRNYVHDNEGGGVLICGAIDTTLRANIFQNNGRGAFVFNCDRPSVNIDILNNDVFSGGSRPADVVLTVAGHGATGLRFFNNIVSVGSASAWDWPGPVTAFDNTVIGPTHPAQPAAQKAPLLAAMGTGTIGADSATGYRPLIDSASQSTALAGPAADFFGEPFNPAAPGRGAVRSTPAG